MKKYKNINLLFIIKILFCLLVPLFNVELLFSQDKEYASSIINNLTSPEFYGRGFSHKGIKKAENYIVNQLKILGVKNVQKQTFPITISVIKNIYISFDDFEAKLGYDAVVYPNSGSVKGTFPIIKITKQNWIESLQKNFSNQFVLFDTSVTSDKQLQEDLKNIIEKNPLKARGFILCKNQNLVQKQATYINNWVTIEAATAFLEAKKITISLKTKLYKKYNTSNIIAIIPGEKDSIIAFTAHYDHLGTLGKVYFPGANDNAAGTAMLLDIARETIKTQHRYSVALMFFTAEEVGLLGSSYFVKNPTFSINNIRYLFNLDVIGSGEDGITIANSTKFQDIIDYIKSINEQENLGLNIKLRGEAFNSDHAPFYQKGVKAMFIYAQGKTGPYHHPDDNLANLSLGKYESIVKLLLTLIYKPL